MSLVNSFPSFTNVTNSILDVGFYRVRLHSSSLDMVLMHVHKYVLYSIIERKEKQNIDILRKYFYDMFSELECYNMWFLCQSYTKRAD